MNERIKNLKGKLIVSCQALENEPLHSDFIMGRMALAAKMGGACGIRANSVVDIKEIKKQVDLPTMKEVDALVEVGVDIIALDATQRLRPGKKSLKDFFSEVRKKYPNQMFMADCSTVAEAIFADEIGFDFIGTTMVGYTKESEGLRIEANDFEILRDILAKVKHKVIAEGNINTPDKCKRVIELGAYSVVVGSIITRPQLITKEFVKALENVEV